MTNQRKNGSKPVRYLDVCEDCHKLERTDHIEARGSKFCSRHQCPVTAVSGIKCSIRKKSLEARCSFHLVPPCIVTGCKKEAFENTPHCEAHSCSYRGCKRAAKPGEGWDFCVDHKCSDSDCQLGRKRIEEKGSLVLQPYCRKHECQTKSCQARKVTGKNNCVSHCCTIDACTDERQGEPLGSLCLEHYKEKIGADAVKKAAKEKDEKEAKEKAEKEAREAKEAKEAKKAAEKRRKKEEEEIISEKSYEDRRCHHREERSPSDRSGDGYNSPPRSRGSDRPRVTREKRYYFEEDDDDYDDDEAYRSASSTGPGDRFPGHARRRASSSGLRGDFYSTVYGRGAHKAGW